MVGAQAFMIYLDTHVISGTDDAKQKITNGTSCFDANKKPLTAKKCARFLLLRALQLSRRVRKDRQLFGIEISSGFIGPKPAIGA
jgi:hypothetical protein